MGKYVVSGIPRHADRDTVVDVTYHYDQRGTVAVSASTKESGTSRHLPVAKEDLPTDVPGRFLVPPEPPGPEQMTVYIAVDSSGSMVGEPLMAAKKAALDFMCSTDRSRCSMGVIAFADRVKTILMASEKAVDIRAAIRALDRVDVGGGTCADPFPEIARVFQEDRRFARKKKLRAILIAASAASDGGSVAADTGEVLGEGWTGESRIRLAQKDLEARWTKRNGQNHYGYKNHVSTDRRHKLVRRYAVTDVAMHDSRVFAELLGPNNMAASVWADKAYRSRETEGLLEELGYNSKVLRKGSAGHKLTKREKQGNRTKSKVRARVEHIFG